MVNLDYLAAKYAFQAVSGPNVDFSKFDNGATTALNILHEQGIYAMFLWLREKGHERNSPAGAMVTAIDGFFHDPAAPFTLGPDRHLRDLEVVSDSLTMNLKSMFLAKSLIELILIYIRHSAKALQGHPGGQP